ncbi:DUF4232 domain-containing protein [Isoptericola sp. QY 916]|uniref:DUF4232 domain-containing protein n=1 Tax=Isoptericola sp. QY 916 TaxID=2782570 RepID=UPI003D2FC9F9|nr:DUF4232 domain-containing protein [Isoptericola sp. QY 916]
MTRRRTSALVAAVILLAGTAALLAVWRPWDPVPDELRAAARQVAHLPGVVSSEVTDYEVVFRDAKDGDVALVTLEVGLDGGLSPEAASAAASQADDAVAETQVDGVRTLSRTTTVHAGDPRTVHGVEVYPLTAWVTEDGDASSVADAVVLRRAGATTVSGVSAEAADGEGLVRLAEEAAEHKIAASLGTADDAVRYDASGRVPVVAAARLAVDAAGRPGVASVVVHAGFPEGTATADDSALTLQVGLDGPTSSPEADDVARWLDDPARDAGGRHLAYTLTEPGYASRVDGWVAAAPPPTPEEHTVPLPAGVGAWPDDDDAPACASDDLRLTLGTPDAAAGGRYLAVLAENVSERPCALDGVPRLTFRNADGEPQDDVTTEPAAPGVVPGRVVVPVGERALATVQWRAMSAANDPDVTTTVDVVAVPDGDPVPLTPTAELDLLDGAEVRVGPWAQGAEGWT